MPSQPLIPEVPEEYQDIAGVNEKLLLSWLTDQDSPVTPDQLRFMGNLVLMAAYERDVHREFMRVAINDVSEMNSALARLERAGSYKNLMGGYFPGENTERLDAAAAGIITEVMALKKRLADKVVLLMQCPDEGDTIN